MSDYQCPGASHTIPKAVCRARQQRYYEKCPACACRETAWVPRATPAPARAPESAFASMQRVPGDVPEPVVPARVLPEPVEVDILPGASVELPTVEPYEPEPVLVGAPEHEEPYTVEARPAAEPPATAASRLPRWLQLDPMGDALDDPPARDAADPSAGSWSHAIPSPAEEPLVAPRVGITTLVSRCLQGLREIGNLF